MTGPSLTRATCISARKRPVATRAPRSRKPGDDRVDERLGLLGPGGSDPRGSPSSWSNTYPCRCRTPWFGWSAPAGLRVTDLRRTATGDQGAARHEGRWRAVAAGWHRGLHRDRERGPLGGASRPAACRGTVAWRMAGARGGSNELRRRPRTHAASAASEPRAVGTGQSRVPRRRRDRGDRIGRGP